MLRRVFALSAIAASVLVVFACVGSDPDLPTIITPDSAAPDGQSSSGNSSSSGNTPTDSGGKEDAPPACSGKVCGTACVDTTTSADHCGACDHGCGGGKCTAGHCEPVLVADHIPQPLGVAVSTGQVFWVRQGAVERCAATGCDGGTSLTGDVGNVIIDSQYPEGTTIVTNGTHVAWLATGSGGREVFTCPTAGCGIFSPHPSNALSGSATQVTISGSTVYVPQDLGAGRIGPITAIETITGSGAGGDQATGGALDETSIYVTSFPNVTRCTRSDAGPCVSGSSHALFQNGVRLAAGGGFVFATSTDGIKQCSTTAVGECAGEATVIAKDDKAASAIAASDKFVAWVNPDSGTVRACELPKCDSPRTIATGQNYPRGVTISDGFVYWVNLGADAGAGTGSVWRAAL